MHNLQNDFPTRVISLDHLVRLLYISKGDDFRNNRLNFPLIHPFGNLGQGLADGRGSINHTLSDAVSRSGFFRWSLDGGDQHTAFFKGCPRALLRVAADRIEHHIHLVRNFFKWSLSIIDPLVHTQTLEEIDILGGGADHFCAAQFGELDCNVTHPASSPMDEDRLPLSEAQSRYKFWLACEAYQHVKPLQRVLDRVTPD